MKTRMTLLAAGMTLCLMPTAADAQPSAQTDRARLAQSIDLAGQYLERSVDEDGRVAYLAHTDPQASIWPGYNILRHAGAIYALSMYYDRSHRPETRDAIVRAVSFMKQHCLQTVADNPHMLAIWSPPELIQDGPMIQAKLGGTGLGLVALVSAERAQPGMTSRDDLRRMARFLVYMQKTDGTFYSRYIPDAGGRNDRWTSMYYPGEAALGLLMLYEIDPQPQWLAPAAKAVAALARDATARKVSLPDHWVMLATPRLVPHYSKCQPPPADWADIVRLVRRTGLDMIAEQTGHDPGGRFVGCFIGDGRSCPTATRLEGLAAALPLIKSNAAEHQQFLESIDAGIGFLMTCQVAEGPLRGGFTRARQTLEAVPAGEVFELDDFNTRAGEIRIDYVQHAICAMIQYERVLNK